METGTTGVPSLMTKQAFVEAALSRIHDTSRAGGIFEGAAGIHLGCARSRIDVGGAGMAVRAVSSLYGILYETKIPYCEILRSLVGGLRSAVAGPADTGPVTRAATSRLVSSPSITHSQTCHMLSTRAKLLALTRTRLVHTASRRFQPVTVLPTGNLEIFRERAFEPGLPALLPRQYFRHLPAIQRWFVNSAEREGCELSLVHLSRYGETLVPLELSSEDGFQRVEMPLSVLLE